MRRPAFIWAAILGGLAGFDLWAAKNATVGDSLSECTRAAFRTDTPAGRAVFVGFWAGFTAWLVPHICRPLQAIVSPSSSAQHNNRPHE